MLSSAQLRGAWYWKVYFLKLHECVYLCAKFEVSSIILITLRQRGRLFLPSSSTSNEPLKSPPRLELNKTSIFSLWLRFLGTLLLTPFYVLIFSLPTVNKEYIFDFNPTNSQIQFLWIHLPFYLILFHSISYNMIFCWKD